MIEEAYCSFEVVKLLKEKGFHVLCYAYYRDRGEGVAPSLYRSEYVQDWNMADPFYSCPTHQLACRWLRESHGIHIEAFCPPLDMDVNVYGVKYNVVISNLRDQCIAFDTNIDDNNYDTYEEAIEEALKYSLKHLI